MRGKKKLMRHLKNKEKTLLVILTLNGVKGKNPVNYELRITNYELKFKNFIINCQLSIVNYLDSSLRFDMFRMTFFSCFLIIMLCSVLFLPALQAQETKVLTLEECLKIGMENSYNVKISKSKVEYADEKTNESISGRLPALKFSAGYKRLSEVEPFKVKIPTGVDTYKEMSISPVILDNYVMTLTLQQPLFTGFRLQSAQELNELNAEASRSDLDKDKSQLVLDIKNAFWSYYKAKDFKKSIEENINQIKAHLADVQSFYQNGLATENEVLKVKVQLSNIELMKVDAENALQLSMMALNNTIGLSVITNVDISGEAKFNEALMPELNSLIAESINNRPELKSMDMRIKAGNAGVKLAEAGWYPQVFFAANYYYWRPNSRIMPSKDEFIGTWDLGLNLSFDIWNWMTTSHQAEQAKATLDQSKYAYSQIKDGITLEVSSNYLTAVKSLEKIKVAEEFVRQAEENYRVTNSRFKEGAAINSDLIDAETALLQAKINYTAAIVDYEMAQARLDKAIGR